MFIETDTAIELACPVTVMSESGAAIARINPDLSWSVDWNGVIHQGYSPSTSTNTALKAVCHLLLAARDNFIVSRIDAAKVAWDGPQLNLGGVPSLVEQESNVAFVLFGTADVIACVHRSGQWSVDWNVVIETRALADEMRDEPGAVPILGFCVLLLAARDNFVTVPFPKL